jgi:pectate lyase
MRNKILIVMFLLAPSFAISTQAQAPHVYVTQTGSSVGNCTGTPLLSAAGFNNQASWGTGSNQIGPGTTVLLCGTITTELNAHGSGTATSPILIQFDTNAMISLPVCDNSNGCLYIGGISHIIIDGGSNGIIQDTANGTAGANHLPSFGIQASNASNVEIRNLTIQNLYVRASGDSAPIDPSTDSGIYFNASGGNISIHDNTFHDIGWALDLFENMGSGITIYNNNIYNVDHGVALAPNCSSNCTANNTSIHDNHIHDTANWDDPADDNHHDGIHIYTQDNGGGGGGGGSINGLSIYNNLFDGSWGAHFTSQIYCQAGANQGGPPAVSGVLENVSIFNNLFLMPNAIASGNGLMTCDGFTSGVNSVVNNTFVANPNQSGMYCVQLNDDVNFTFQNNLMVGCGVGVYIYSRGNYGGPPSFLAMDHNVYENVPKWEFGAPTTPQGSFSSWQSTCGAYFANCDASALGSFSQSAVDVNTSTGVPNASSSVLGAGVALSGLNISALDSDTSAGNTRSPSSRTAPWSVGAYSGGTSSSQPSPPSGLVATVN